MTRVRVYGSRWFSVVRHGPVKFKWWQLFTMMHMELKAVMNPSTGHRLWMYTRWGATFFDIYFDRRGEKRNGR